MNKIANATILALMVTALAGCSMGSSMLNNKAGTPQASNIQVGNNLAMPPDLQLPPPGQVSTAYQPPIQDGSGSALDTGISGQKPARKMTAASLPPIAPIARPPDIYEQNGISKMNADGTPKTPDKLRVELQAALLKKKREKNPGYGTIRNIGNIFSDQ